MAAAIREAFELHRQLARERPDVYNPDFAISVNNLACLPDLAHREDALAAIQDAVEFNSQPAKDRPVVYSVNLATSLNYLFVYLAIEKMHSLPS
jgi:hypothetical protein